MPSEMTYKQAAQAALDCQDACNLSGVVHSFSDAMSAIWEECHKHQGLGTNWVNRHPIATLFIAKISELNGIGFPSVEQPYYNALPEVKKIAGEPAS